MGFSLKYELLFPSLHFRGEKYRKEGEPPKFFFQHAGRTYFIIVEKWREVSPPMNKRKKWNKMAMMHVVTIDDVIS